VNKVTAVFLLGALMGGVARGQSNPCNSPNNHCVVLTWSPSPTWGIAGYNIYRGTKPGNESSTPLNNSPVAAGCGIRVGRVVVRHYFHRVEWQNAPLCTWTDNNVQAGVTYFYHVKAINKDGVVQSVASREATATVPVNLR
jgi:hypothetical protein